MYEIAAALIQRGVQVSARLVGHVLAAYGLAKKNGGTPAPLPARLLAQEEREVLDSACQPRPRVVPRHAIERAVTALRKRGRTPTSAGGCFCLPSLLPRGAYDRAAALGPPTPEGLPQARLALGLLFASIFGYPAGIRTVDPVSRADFGLLAGLPLLPSPSPQDRCLQDVS